MEISVLHRSVWNMNPSKMQEWEEVDKMIMYNSLLII